MDICPKKIIIRRTTDTQSDMIDFSPINDIAFIKKLIVNINEPVIVKLLGFHVKEKKYCEKYRIENATKRFCSDINSQYVHFYLEKEGYPIEKSMFLIAFLPRTKVEKELYQVVKELCDIAEWFGIRQTINCIIFRYGQPVHRMDNLLQWQKKLERIINETRSLYTVGKIMGRIKHIREDNERCFTINSASVFDSINVS